MSLSVPTQPLEEEALFNPAFIGLLLHEAAKQHEQQSGLGLPAVLAYLIIPVALHRPTREALPRSKNAQMGEWVRVHPAVLVDLPSRVQGLRPMVSAGARFALQYGMLEGAEGLIRAGGIRRRRRGMPRTADAEHCVTGAGFVGRWFANQEDPLTTLALWGLRA